VDEPSHSPEPRVIDTSSSDRTEQPTNTATFSHGEVLGLPLPTLLRSTRLTVFTIVFPQSGSYFFGKTDTSRWSLILLDTLEEFTYFNIPRASVNGTITIAESSTGELVLTGGIEGRLDVFESGFLSTSISSTYLFRGSEDSIMITQIAIHEPSGLVLVASGWDSGGLVSWDMKSYDASMLVQKPVQRFAMLPGSDEVFMATSPLGIPVEPTSPIIVYNLATHELTELPIQGQWGTYVAVSPDGQTLAAIVDGQLNLWDLAASKAIEFEIPSFSGVYVKVEFSPKGRLVVLRAPNVPLENWSDTFMSDLVDVETELIVYEIQTGTPLAGLGDLGLVVFGVSNTEELMATSYEGGLYLWAVP
jgi:WD40 repeat protein